MAYQDATTSCITLRQALLHRLACSGGGTSAILGVRAARGNVHNLSQRSCLEVANPHGLPFTLVKVRHVTATSTGGNKGYCGYDPDPPNAAPRQWQQQSFECAPGGAHASEPNIAAMTCAMNKRACSSDSKRHACPELTCSMRPHKSPEANEVPSRSCTTNAHFGVSGARVRVFWVVKRVLQSQDRRDGTSCSLLAASWSEA